MLEKVEQEKLIEISKKLEYKDALLFITGAGISAESGLPTYRGVNGLYEDEIVDNGYRIEEILSASVFSANPSLTWKYLHLLEKNSRDKKPNLAHLAIKALEEYFSVFVFTQNVDLFHQKTKTKNIIPIHGSLGKIQCTLCPFAEIVQDYAKLSSLPRCPECSGILRPDVVLFEESLDPKKIFALEKILSNKKLKAVFSVGTTSSFPYITSPIYFAKAQELLTVEINPDATPLSSVVDFKINATAGGSLEKLRRIIEKQLKKKT